MEDKGYVITSFPHSHLPLEVAAISHEEDLSLGQAGHDSGLVVVLQFIKDKVKPYNDGYLLLKHLSPLSINEELYEDFLLLSESLPTFNSVLDFVMALVLSFLLGLSDFNELL